MQKKYRYRQRWIWWCAVVLLICVTATAVPVFGRLNTFLVDDSGAIPLTPVMAAEQTLDEEPEATIMKRKTTYSWAPSPHDLYYEIERSPEFVPGDDKGAWSSSTTVELFRSTYENGEHQVTVASSNGDNVVAPGTENSYTFKFSNIGDARLNYTMTVDVFLSMGDVDIPITARLSRYDGKWLVGDQEHYVDVALLNNVTDQSVLGENRYVYYTLDWKWPFEAGNDAVDTSLGDLSFQQDMTFSIVINTVAEGNIVQEEILVNPSRPGGEIMLPDKEMGIVILPKTGDNSRLVLWIVLAIGSFCLLLFLLAFDRRKEEYDQVEGPDR